jgi:pfkB family carbohydrate kinase
VDIVGGLYRELCEIPAWNAEFGSGGRAAAALSRLAYGSTLHTYARDPNGSGVAALKAMGIRVQAMPSSVAVAFAYFHPLSRPYIEPPPNEIAKQPPIYVSGKTVLRFGFLEGDSVIQAERAIYDPQSATAPQPFAANGSTAHELALVMNEFELGTLTGTSDVEKGARQAMQAQDAAVVVVKQGIRGALVLDRDGTVARIPAYRSARVFKIGTGDVFSALFAYYWGESGRPAAEAADLASRSVAAYCSTQKLPLLPDATDTLQPVSGTTSGPVLLEGSVNTLGRRYVMEEARFRLNELGVTVGSPAMELSPSDDLSQYGAVLVIADGMPPGLSKCLHGAHATGLPIIALAEAPDEGVLAALDKLGAKVTNDFASVLYFAAWAAMKPSF